MRWSMDDDTLASLCHDVLSGTYFFSQAPKPEAWPSRQRGRQAAFGPSETHSQVRSAAMRAHAVPVGHRVTIPQLIPPRPASGHDGVHESTTGLFELRAPANVPRTPCTA